MLSIKRLVGFIAFLYCTNANAFVSYALGVAAGSSGKEETASATINVQRPTVICRSNVNQMCYSDTGWITPALYISKRGWKQFELRNLVIVGNQIYLVIDVWK